NVDLKLEGFSLTSGTSDTHPQPGSVVSFLTRAIAPREHCSPAGAHHHHHPGRPPRTPPLASRGFFLALLLPFTSSSSYLPALCTVDSLLSYRRFLFNATAGLATLQLYFLFETDYYFILRHLVV
ncbi:hypothetical protein PG991_002449, partial [Apiospora marii]